VSKENRVSAFHIGQTFRSTDKNVLREVEKGENGGSWKYALKNRIYERASSSEKGHQSANVQNYY